MSYNYILEGGVLTNDPNYLKKYTFIDRTTGLKTPYVFPSGHKDYEYEYPYDLALCLDEDFPANRKMTQELVNCKKIVLRPEQKEAVDAFIKAPYGVLLSQPGTGKTVMALALIKELNLNTLILVNSTYLLRQWEEAFKEFYDYQVGVIGDKTFNPQEITVATFQTMRKKVAEYRKAWSLIIVDECHHCPATTFYTVLRGLHAPYKIGLTGTLERKDGLEPIVGYFLGNRVIENEVDNTLKPEIVIVKTGIKLKGGNYVDTLSNLAESDRLHEIVAGQVGKGGNRFHLVICFRVLTVDNLQKLLPNALCITGDSSKEDREDLNEKVVDHRVIISTTLQEGVNIVRLDTMHLIHPNNNLPQLQQRIARINRNIENKKVPLVFDYWFRGGEAAGFSVENQQRIRLAWYKSKGYKIYVITEAEL